jgi:hypothetical protein
MGQFELLSAAGWILVTAVAWKTRGRAFAIYSAVVLGLFTLLSLPLHARLAAIGPAFEYLQAVTYLSFAMLLRPRMRPWPYRVLVSVPAAFHLAAVLLSIPWGLSALFGFDLPWPFLPHAVAAVGVLESLWTRETEVHVALDDEHVQELRRHRLSPAREERGLRVIQITDPHLGPFMSVPRLRRICERAVARHPDLILLTGDLLTMESRGTPSVLREALQPLAAARGRVFACMGNHDHEAPELVKAALVELGIRLLIDESELVRTPAGPVQLLGIDHYWRDRKRRLAEVCARHPRIQGALRVVLLHDPGAFSRLPEGEADLVLSGHTHGGQLGLLTLGLPFTFVSAVTSIPDHGLWARGRDRLYVHRGTGHYGFPLRVGVPAEQSVLHVYSPGSTS